MLCVFFAARFSGDCPFLFQSSILLSFFSEGFRERALDNRSGDVGEFFCVEMPLFLRPRTRRKNFTLS